MNTNNVMAVAPQQGGQVKGSATRTGRMAGTSGSTSNNSFDDALGRLREAAQEAGGVPKDDTPQGKESMDSGGARDSAPQDPLAAALAASQQGSAVEAQDTKAEGQATQQETAAAVVDFSVDAKARTTGVLPGPAHQVQNLNTLMPQAPEAASQSQDFLAMLSGQQLSSNQVSKQPVGLQTPLQMQLATLGGQADAGQHADALQVSVGQDTVAVSQDTGAMHRLAAQNAGRPLPVPEMPAAQAESLPQQQAGILPQSQAENLSQPQAGSLLQPQMDNLQQPQADSFLSSRQSAAVEAARQPDNAAPAEGQPLQQAATAQAQVQAQPQQRNLASVLGNAPTEVVIQDTEPLRVLHQQELAQQGQGFLQQGRDQGQSGQMAPGMAAETGISVDAAETGAESASAAQGAAEAAGTLTSFQQQVQHAARTTEAVPAAPQPQADFEVPRQIVEQARLIRSGGDTEMVIHLKPEHLGDLTLKVSVTSTGAVNASFHSDNAQVRAIIENSLVQLRQDLNNQGIKVDNVEVYAGLQDGQLPQGQGQQAWQGAQGNASGQGQRFSAEDYAEEAEDLSVLAAAAAQGDSESSAATEGVDYRV